MLLGRRSVQLTGSVTYFVIINGCSQQGAKQLMSCRLTRDVIRREGDMRRCSKLQIALL